MFAHDNLGDLCSCLYKLKRQIAVGREEDILRLGMQQEFLIVPDRRQRQQVVVASDGQCASFRRLVASPNRDGRS